MWLCIWTTVGDLSVADWIRGYFGVSSDKQLTNRLPELPVLALEPCENFMLFHWALIVVGVKKEEEI